MRRKFARLVLRYLPFSSSLSEKAIACTTKSSRPQRSAMLGEQRVEARLGGHVGLDDEIAVEAVGQRPHPLAQAPRPDR